MVNEALQTTPEHAATLLDTENHRAIQFYEKIGFNRVAMPLNGVKIDGVARNDDFYILPKAP